MRTFEEGDLARVNLSPRRNPAGRRLQARTGDSLAEVKRSPFRWILPLGRAKSASRLRMKMSSVSGTLIAACLTLFVAQSAEAQSFVPSPNASFLLDLDTQSGSYSLWRVNDMAGVNAVRARVTFARKGVDRQYAPSFQIRIGNGDQDALLSVVALSNSGPLIIRSSLSQGQQHSQEETFLLTPVFREVFNLDIDWTPAGVVTFTVHSQAAQAVNGYERHQVTLSRAPTVISANGSTGEVTFDPIQLGHVAQ